MGVKTFIYCDICCTASDAVSGATLGGPSLPAGWAKFNQDGVREKYACDKCWDEVRKALEGRVFASL